MRGHSVLNKYLDHEMPKTHANEAGTPRHCVHTDGTNSQRFNKNLEI